VDLNFLISNVLNDLELLIAEKKAQITQHSLPTVPGQARQLQQLFQNLLVNALKYCKPGIPPVVNISYARLPGSQTGLHLAAEEAAGHFHLVSISDNGIGFEQKDAERIFQVFQRLHTEHTQRGTGLGLAIARKVAQNHGGYLTAESKPGEGSTFRVFLPA
jgi:signal transduction histidine kinase